jgi:hypothetical protein
MMARPVGLLTCGVTATRSAAVGRRAETMTNRQSRIDA